MPILGEIVKGCDVGAATTSHKCVWHACPDCGKERWVLLKNGEPQSERCHPCGAKQAGIDKQGKTYGPRASNWRGGRQVLQNGYVLVTLSPDDPYRVMGSTKRHRAVYEHRIVMARSLGRCLESWEEVHHINHDKQNNRIENLELTDRRTHAFNHASVAPLLAHVAELEKKVEEYRSRYGDLD